MTSEPSVHDNHVYAYTVDCENRRLTLHTVFREGNPPRFVDVIFTETVAHCFKHVLEGNILFDIKETEVDGLVHTPENAEIFGSSWQWGWPRVKYEGDLEKLVKELKAKSVRAYVIDSSYGLSGWVFAGSCQRALRKEKATV